MCIPRHILYILFLLPIFCRSQIPDFTCTDIAGEEINLYNTLEAGNTVLLLFFYADDPVNNYYIHAIDSLFAKWGYGYGDVKFIGLSDRDDNSILNAYSNDKYIYFTLAGVEGGADSVKALYENYFGDIFFPTYAVICPDKNYTWDIFPLSDDVHEVGDLIFQCGAIGSAINPSGQLPAVSLYPNPTDKYIYVDTKGIANASAISIALKDITGRILIPHATIFPINIQHFEAGIYILDIAYNGIIISTKKIVKQ